MTLNTGHIKIDTAVLVLIMLLCFIGCSGDLQSTKKDPMFEKWDTLAGTSQGYSPEEKPKKIDMPPSPDSKKPASYVPGDKSQKLPTKPINLTMRQADLKAVLRAMAKAVNYNILALLSGIIRK